MADARDLLTQAITLLTQAQGLLTPARVTDRLTRVPGTLPDLTGKLAGYSFLDQTFGSKITRLTDDTMGGGSWHVASNTHLACHNADSSAYYVVGTGGDIRVVRNFTDVWMPYSQVEPCFDRSNPDLLYTLGGPKSRTIFASNIRTRVSVPVLDLDTLIPNLDGPDRTYCGGLSQGASTLVAFFGGTGADRHHYVTVYRNDQATTRDTLQMIGGFLLHSVSIDLSGRYVLMYPTNAVPFQVVIWDTEVNVLMPITKAMLPSGHDSVGFGRMVNMDDGSAPWDAAEWQIRQLSAPGSPKDLLTQELLPQEIQLADHSTWNNDVQGASQPVFSSTYRTVGNVGPWRAWDDEILSIATDGSGVVTRLAHHRSDLSDLNFWSQPIINVDRTGKRILFTSNWGRTLGRDAQGNSRQDVFLLEAA